MKNDKIIYISLIFAEDQSISELIKILVSGNVEYVYVLWEVLHIEYTLTGHLSKHE